MHCFGDRRDGFYIDIGSGHPVYDNISFAFYLRGWRGVTVEPNPWLARAEQSGAAARSLTSRLWSARALGEATFHLVDDFHGLSTMIESHARSARSEFGKALASDRDADDDAGRAVRRSTRPQRIDFLKVDVEGAEQDVLLNGELAQAPAEGRRGGGARAVYAGAGLGGLGAVPAAAWLSAMSGSTASIAITWPRKQAELAHAFDRAPAVADGLSSIAIPSPRSPTTRPSRSSAGKAFGGRRHDPSCRSWDAMSLPNAHCRYSRRRPRKTRRRAARSRTPSSALSDRIHAQRRRICAFRRVPACAMFMRPSSKLINFAPPVGGFPQATPGEEPLERFDLLVSRRIRYTAECSTAVAGAALPPDALAIEVTSRGALTHGSPVADFADGLWTSDSGTRSCSLGRLG